MMPTSAFAEPIQTGLSNEHLTEMTPKIHGHELACGASA
jgi:hypothetical protein